MSDNIGERMARLEQKVDNINDNVSDLRTTLRDFIDKSETKFANKWVEQALKWTITIIVGAVVITILSLIGLKINSS